jgi:hypothetical protein
MCCANSRKFCSLHSIGKRAQFNIFVLQTTKTISAMIANYGKRYRFDLLCDIVNRDKLSMMHQLYEFCVSLEYAKSAVSSVPVKEFGQEEFEPSLACQGTFPSSLLTPFSLQALCNGFGSWVCSGIDSPRGSHVVLEAYAILCGNKSVKKKKVICSQDNLDGFYIRYFEICEYHSFTTLLLLAK